MPTTQLHMLSTLNICPLLVTLTRKKIHLACWIWRYTTWLFETTQIKWAATGICWHKLNKTLARIRNYTNIVIWDVDTHPRCKSKGVGELMMEWTDSNFSSFEYSSTLVLHKCSLDVFRLTRMYSSTHALNTILVCMNCVIKISFHQPLPS